ncbi:hypothetical protein A3780_19820 [Kosakonia radicincitans]|nr:hypothetical protein A3780_19820 [Kosakonia radicincitans]
MSIKGQAYLYKRKDGIWVFQIFVPKLNRHEKVGGESYSKMEWLLKLSPISWDRQIRAQPCITSGTVRTCRTI